MMGTNDRALFTDRLGTSLAEELEWLLVERAAVAFAGHYLKKEKFKTYFILNQIKWKSYFLIISSWVFIRFKTFIDLI